MFEEVLKKLGISASGVIGGASVGITISSQGLLEVVQVDPSSKIVTKYVNKFITYNELSKTVEDFTSLGNQIKNAILELEIPKGTNVTFTLPSVFLGTISLPLVLPDEAVQNAIISDAEQSYFFQSIEPLVSWIEVKRDEANDSREIVYSAIQENIVQEIKNILDEIGLNLVAVENSHAALFHALKQAKLVDSFIDNKESWNVVVISSSSFNIISFIGDSLYSVYEESLAVKSFTTEEVYMVVTSMISAALQSYTSDNNIIISEVDEISAEVISGQLSLTGIPVFIEQNQYQQAPPLEVDLNILPNLVQQMTLTAIGTAIDYYAPKNSFKFNHLTSSVKGGSSSEDVIFSFPIGGQTLEVTKTNIDLYTAIVCAIIIAIGGIILLISNLLFNTKQTESVDLDQQIGQKTQQIDANSIKQKNKKIDIEASIDEIVNSNRKKLLYYDALSYGIPAKLWLKYFYIDNNEAVDILGISLQANDITLFLKGIREVTGSSDIRVMKLSRVDEDANFDSVIDGVNEIYSFELANESFMQVQATLAAAAASSSSSGDGQQQQNTGSNPPPPAPPAINQPTQSGGNAPIISQ